MPTCAFITFGCKANQYDTQAMREVLLAGGYTEAPPGGPADVCIVNTCTVTGAADSKSARAVRRLLREHPGSRVVIAGCGVNASAPYLDEFAGHVLIADNERKLGLVELLAGREPACCESWAHGIAGFAGHTRAFVKVQDGCDAACTYCIVPKVRGRSRIRPADEAVEEIARLASGGFREVVLTGIHLGRHPGLPGIVRRSSGIDGLLRLRLSSIEALEVTDDLLEAVVSSANACPHFHLPLQSGSDAVLRRMNRPYSVEQFLAVVGRIRSRIEDAAISADIIVGFPGETDADFAATLAAARRAEFGRIHAFRYSDRPGTPASDMPGKCGTHIVMPRMDVMKRLAAELAQAYHQRFIGRTIEVLVEHRRDRGTGLLSGLTGRYVRVVFDGPDDLMGRMVAVRAGRATPGNIEGTVAGA